MNEDLQDSIYELQRIIKQQIEQQSESTNVIRALIEMVGHSITATQELTEAIKRSDTSK